MVLVENPKTLDEKGKLVRLYIYLSDATAIIRSIVFFLSHQVKAMNNNQSDLTVLNPDMPPAGEQCCRWCHLVEKMTNNSLHSG